MLRPPADKSGAAKGAATPEKTLTPASAAVRRCRAKSIDSANGRSPAAAQHSRQRQVPPRRRKHAVVVGVRRAVAKDQRAAQRFRHGQHQPFTAAANSEVVMEQRQIAGAGRCVRIGVRSQQVGCGTQSMSFASALDREQLRVIAGADGSRINTPAQPCGKGISAGSSRQSVAAAVTGYPASMALTAFSRCSPRMRFERRLPILA